MKSYIGTVAQPTDWRVDVFDHATGMVSPLTHIVRHSPDGFAWGYNGSAPSELARCLLADAMGADGIGPDGAVLALVELTYIRYRSEVISRLDMSTGWRMSQNAVRSWVLSTASEMGLTYGVYDADPNCPDRGTHRFAERCPTCGGVP